MKGHLLSLLMVYSINTSIVLMSIVFTYGPGDRGSISGRIIPKTQKMVLDPIYPTPPLVQDMTQGQFLSGV